MGMPVLGEKPPGTWCWSCSLEVVLLSVCQHQLADSFRCFSYADFYVVTKAIQAAHHLAFRVPDWEW